MTALGVPVPPGFVVTTAAWRRWREDGWWRGLEEAVDAGIDDLEATLGRRLGDPADPLLTSVRSGAPVSMPGMMDTVLNIGMTPAAEAGLAAATGDPAFARDTATRAAASYAQVV